MTEILVYNAFKAIKQSVETSSENTEDASFNFVSFEVVRSLIVQMVMTASTLYEAVEPRTIWKQLLNSVILEILGEASQIEVRNCPCFLLFVPA